MDRIKKLISGIIFSAANSFLIWALRENSEKRPIGGDLSVLPFLGLLALGFRP